MNEGGPLPISVLQSAHMVDSEEQCTLKCLEEPCRFGFNFNSRITNKYACKVNCQICGKRMENTEVMNGNDWVFYRVLSIVSTTLCNLHSKVCTIHSPPAYCPDLHKLSYII